jgi:hypothetical protein
MKKLLLSLTILSSIFLASCEKGPLPAKDDEIRNETNDSTNIIIKTIRKCHHSDLSGNGYNLMIQTQQELDSVWSMIDSTGFSNVPDIDFEKELALLAFMGTFVTGGYNIEITGITLENDTYNYTIIKTTPDSGDIITSAITNPYHLIRFDR